MLLLLLWLFVIFVLYVNGLTTAMWVCIAVPVALFLLVLSGTSSGNSSRSVEETDRHVRIDHPHCITDDEYECGACGRRFSHPADSCPYCGIRFSRCETDDDEFDEELEEELEMDEWDEEE